MKKQLGTTLIESMIALLVISIGLLGIAALQITSMSQNSSALNHSQAVWLAYNMSDRIRANMVDLAQFNDYTGIDTEYITANSGDCTTTACATSGDMKDADASEWKTMIEALPGGRGLVFTSADSGLIITVMWDDEGTGTNLTGCSDDPSIDDLTCFSMAVAPPIVALP